MTIHYISQSEVDTFLTCHRKHYYAFGKKHNDTANPGLQRVQHSDNMERGTIVHGVIEYYYKLIKEGMARDGAFIKARDFHIAQMATAGNGLIDLYKQTLEIFVNYHQFYMYEDYEPLVMEHEFQVKIDDEMILPFKPDAVFKKRSTGKYTVVDHKFLWRFYPERVFPILPQMLRYSKALQLMGYPVDETMYNMLSTDTRSKPENRFKRHTEDLKKPNVVRKMDRYWFELVTTMDEIREVKEQDEKEPGSWAENAKRNASSFSCSNCSFLELCTAEAEQQNGIEIMVRQFYQPNKYGYGRNEE